MSGKYFLDTNLFVYCFDDRVPEKKARSLALIADALKTGDGVISTQVIQEFFNVATRKFSVPMRLDDAKIYLDRVMLPLCRVFPNRDLYLTALDTMHEARLSFYDALIVSGAKIGECSILYSEDFQSGQQIGPVTILHPFLV
jgi:predicted nucleic acid-binding protein